MLRPFIAGKTNAEPPILAAPVKGSASCGTNLDLRELQGRRQLPPLRGAEVLVSLEGFLQAAHLLRGEGGARPALPPAGSALRRGPGALPARALALVARGLVGAEPAALGACTGGGGAAVRPLPGWALPPPPLSPVAQPGSRPVPSPPPLLTVPVPCSRTWLRAGLGGVPGTVWAPLGRAGLAVPGLSRLGAVPAGPGPGQERGAVPPGGAAGRRRAADVGPHPAGLGIRRRDLDLVHGGDGLGEPRPRPALIWALRPGRGRL